ncbi:MAG: carbohydrate ABC transporter substrate-binding protein [Proteobacteria bacterium]|nr:carbohydrate ABC transporter substrate-binding protein [Pseudomonadota bacterium]
MNSKALKKILLSILVISIAFIQPALSGEIVIESWRNDDAPIWNKKIIPAFNKKFPNIKVTYKGYVPTEYDATLRSGLAAGTAGDLLVCRPFRFEGEYTKGFLAGLSDLKGINEFSDFAKSAWVAKDGVPYCLPMAAVLHGFIYNADIFKELDLEVPTTEAEFFYVLETIKRKSRYTPLAIGTAHQWEASHMGFQNIGPNFWKGEAGRLSIVNGTGKLTDSSWVQTFESLAKWRPYLSRGYQAQGYPDSQNLFTLGRAAIYPAGSWEIGVFNPQVDFKMGAFNPPVKYKGEKCYVSDELDMGMGMNAAANNKKDARTFLSWMTTPEFSALFNDAFPGFFALSKNKSRSSDPLVTAFAGFRNKCESTLRSASTLGGGTPDLDQEIWATSAQVMNGKLTPEAAAQRLQKGVEKWYAPQKK